jgi:hypothetical protein
LRFVIPEQHRKRNGKIALAQFARHPTIVEVDR